MSTTIGDGTHTISPDAVTGYEANTQSSNIVLKKANGQVDVSLAADSKRDGTLQLAFTSQSAAWTAQGYLKAALVFTLTSTDISQLSMSFVRTGAMVITLDPTTLNAWTLAVPYQEV